MTARETYVLRNGELVPKHLAAPRHVTGRASHYVISDSLGQTVQHQANGRYSDSKSTHRRWTKESGCVEVGTEKLSAPTRWRDGLGDVRADLSKTWEKLGIK